MNLTLPAVVLVRVYLGIGTSKAYRRDTVQVSLRIVSVTTGKVLMEVLVSKTILSASLDNDVFRFVADSTELVEVEGGVVRNESVNIALQAAIETAVFTNHQRRNRI
jgi:curli production assembly/transport component CsgG